MLTDKINVGGNWLNTNGRFTNEVNVPIVSVAESATGEMIGDEYEVTFSNVAGGTGTATVVTSSPNNPYNGKVVNGVPLDNATAVKNVVPGLGIVFKDTIANGDKGMIYAGQYLGVFDAFGVNANVPSAGQRHQVTNGGTGAVSDAKALLLSQAVQVKKVGNVFALISPFADGATQKTAGGGSTQTKPYALKVINVAGAGAAKTADLQLDGVTLPNNSVMNLSTGAVTNGVGLKATGAQRYRIVLGALSGLEFILAANCATNDIANVLIFPSQFVQIAPDVAGAEGAYGVAEVPLTQTGQASGVIQAGQVAHYWVRTLVPLGGDAESNPYPAKVALQASETGSADWNG